MIPQIWKWIWLNALILKNMHCKCVKKHGETIFNNDGHQHAIQHYQMHGIRAIVYVQIFQLEASSA